LPNPIRSLLVLGTPPFFVTADSKSVAEARFATADSKRFGGACFVTADSKRDEESERWSVASEQ
jgi:imidazole glycerol phosphate synthase subunit HisF